MLLVDSKMQVLDSVISVGDSKSTPVDVPV